MKAKTRTEHEPLLETNSSKATYLSSVPHNPDSKAGANSLCDYVIMIPHTGNEQEESLKGHIKEKLSEVGLSVDSFLSRDQEDYFFRITAPQELLEVWAEQLELQFRLKPEHGGGYCAYRRSIKSLFTHDEFSGLKRIQITREIIETRGGDLARGAYLPIDEWLWEEKITAFFPMHNPAESQALEEVWIKKYEYNQPLEEIRTYFGEKVALYYAFLNFYTKFLVVPAFVGLIVMIAEVSRMDYDGIGFYLVILSLWTTAWTEFWKRKTAVLAFEWNMLDFEGADRERPQFKGEEVVGFYCDAGYVSLDPVHYYDVTTKYYPETNRYKKYFQVAPMIFGMLCMVVVATVAILFFRSVNQYVDWFGGLMNGVFIIVFNQIYSRLAETFTLWENHRTETDFEDALIIKTFLFQFVNSYVSLYYIAFFKGNDVELFGTELSCLKDDCMYEVAYQLVFIFLVQIFWGQFQELGMPWLSARLKIFWASKKASDSTGPTDQTILISEEELQSKMVDWPGLLEDYEEMMIQYGYVVLFGVAFPLTAGLALINNIVEIKTDAIKHLKETKRPHYSGTKDIGVWQDVMEIMSIIAIMTNIYMVYVLTDLWSLEATILTEHILIFLKLALTIAVDDVPKEISIKIARQNFEKDRVLREAQKTQMETRSQQF